MEGSYRKGSLNGHPYVIRRASFIVHRFSRGRSALARGLRPTTLYVHESGTDLRIRAYNTRGHVPGGEKITEPDRCGRPATGGRRSGPRLYRRRTGNFRDRETRGRLIREHLIYSFTVRRAWWVPHGGPPCGPGDEACRAHVGGVPLHLHPRARPSPIQVGQWWVFGECNDVFCETYPTGRSQRLNVLERMMSRFHSKNGHSNLSDFSLV